MAEERRFKVSVPGGHEVTVIDSSGSSSASPLFVYAPGAGSSLDDPFGRWLAKELTPAGIGLWRFQFPYMEEKRKAPDRVPVLEATWKAVAIKAGPRAVLGGRSMGGRIASQVVADGMPAPGLALFAYPLHPPGQPDRLRDQHLTAVRVPTLFCSGTRDAFASQTELEAAGSWIENSSFHFIVGADHGFNVPKSSGLRREDIWQEAVNILVPFLESLGTN